MTAIAYKTAVRVIMCLERFFISWISVASLLLFILVGSDMADKIWPGAGVINLSDLSNSFKREGFLVPFALGLALNLFLYFTLQVGLNNRHVSNCKIWCIIQALYTAFCLLSLIGLFFIDNNDDDESAELTKTSIIIMSYAVIGILVLYRIWAIHAVRSYANSLQEAQNKIIMAEYEYARNRFRY